MTGAPFARMSTIVCKHGCGRVAPTAVGASKKRRVLFFWWSDAEHRWQPGAFVWPPARPTSRSGHERSAKLDAILDGAMSAFAAMGFTGASVRTIAGRIGTSLSNLS